MQKGLASTARLPGRAATRIARHAMPQRATPRCTRCSQATRPQATLQHQPEQHQRGIIQRAVAPGLLAAALLAGSMGLDLAAAQAAQAAIHSPGGVWAPAASTSRVMPVADTADVAAAFLDGEDALQALDNEAGGCQLPAVRPVRSTPG